MTCSHIHTGKTLVSHSALLSAVYQNMTAIHAKLHPEHMHKLCKGREAAVLTVAPAIGKPRLSTSAFVSTVSHAGLGSHG